MRRRGQTLVEEIRERHGDVLISEQNGRMQCPDCNNVYTMKTNENKMHKCSECGTNLRPMK